MNIASKDTRSSDPEGALDNDFSKIHAQLGITRVDPLPERQIWPVSYAPILALGKQGHALIPWSCLWKATHLETVY